jgi:hypothetical protein
VGANKPATSAILVLKSIALTGRSYGNFALTIKLNTNRSLSNIGEPQRKLMTTYHPFKHTKPFNALALALLSILLLPGVAHSEEAPLAVASAKPANTSPWGFNLTTYLWLPGVEGSFSSGKNTG